MALNATYRGHVDGAVGSSSASSGPIPCATGDALVITVCADSEYENSRATVTLSTGWGVNHSYWNTGASGPNGAFTGVFAAIPVPSNASPVITVNITGGDAAQRRPSFDIWTLTGVDSATPILSTGWGEILGDPINLNSRSAADGPGNSINIVAGTDGLKRGAPWVSGDALLGGPGNGFDQPAIPGQRGISGFSTAARWATPDTNYAYVIDAPQQAYYVTQRIEFRPAPEAPVVNGGADSTVERTRVFTRTATDSAAGSTITARSWKIQSGPAGVGSTLATAAALSWQPTTAGTYVLRYAATNGVGTTSDDVTVTVTALRPSVNAGPDATVAAGVFTRTATELANDSAITARRWYIAAGPSGVGTTIGSAAALSWTPPTLGQWTLAYTATSAAGTSDPSTFVLTVGVTGIPLPGIRRTPVPRFAVAIAFGGNLADPDGSEWVFTEVTTDVRIEQGVHVKHGRGDEASASQPAAVSFTLDNRAGKYSLGGRSPYWPNIRQGTPIQVSCNLGTGFQTIFTGYADGFTPNWTTRPLRARAAGQTGDASVSVSASGTMRRLAQGQPPVISPLRRGLTAATTTGVVAYWPCEDAEDARQLASAISGHPPMDYSGRLHGGSNPGLPPATPRLAQDDRFWCSDPLPLISDSEWYGTVPDYPGTEIIQMRCLIDVPDSGSIDSSVIIGLITTGDPSFWELRYKAGGLINVRAWRNFSSLVLESPNIALVPGPSGPSGAFVGIDGRPGQLGLTLTKSGANIDWVVDFIEQGATVGYVWGPGIGGPTYNVPGASVGKAVRVQTATDGGHVDVGLGHIVVRKDARDGATHVAQLNAWRGENVGERLNRLAAETGQWYIQIDPPPPYYPTISDLMGPQPPGTVLDLYRDCEVTDQGLLWDGVGPGLSYTTKRYRESRAPALTLDAAAGELGIPFVAVHDDAYRTNRAAVKRRTGSSETYIDETGPLGAKIVGRYDNSMAVGVRDDTALIQYAAWMVHQGTVEGYRYPRLTLNLTAHPELLDEWLKIIPGDRVDVINLRAVNAAAPEESIALAVEGYEQTITPHTWDVTLNTSLYRRWSVAQVCSDTGDTREFGARVDTNGTVMATLTPAGQTTLTVDVTSGPAWTVKADDYPLLLDVGGISVRATTATAPSGARQTFTIEPMPVTRPAGTPVALWNPPVFAL